MTVLTTMNGNLAAGRSTWTGNPGRGRRGHMLLVAIVLATVMSIMLAMALQPVRTTRQRLLEQEMIYRAEHMAHGIRRFYLQRGRFPFSLEELADEEPRLVRRQCQQGDV